MRYEIPVSAELKLSLNDRSRHWGKAARLTQRLRERSGWMARSLRIPPQQERIDVGLVWHYKVERRRDAINTTPMVKALVDGLRDAQVIPDDTPMWVRELPTTFERADEERFTFWVETFDQYGEDAA